jgi:cytochrome P450
MTTVNRPPMPPKEFIFGHARQLRGDSMNYEREITRTYGDFVHLKFFNRYDAYVINHPDDAHQVLVTEARKFNKAPIYKLMLSTFLGDGLLVSDGDFWRRQRKLAQPAFHSRRIDSYAETMVSFTERLLNEYQPGETRDINADMMRLTLNIVSKTLFDTELESEAARINTALTTLLHITTEWARSPLTMLPIIRDLPKPMDFRRDKAVADLDAIIQRIIDERRKSKDDRGDLLSMLLLAQDEDGSQMTDKQVRDEAVTLVLAGHETTANALTWTWYLLAQHPEIEAALHAELDEVLAGRSPTLADLPRLQYTEMVVKEAMRMYPPAPSVGRQAIEDVQIGDYLLPKDTLVMIHPHLIHRDPRWWDDPDRFMPERFSPENEAKLRKYAYLPFGGGPRICIGNSFAMMEAVLLLATIAQHYTLELVPGQTITPVAEITLRPHPNIMMTVHERVPETTASAH